MRVAVEEREETHEQPSPARPKHASWSRSNRPEPKRRGRYPPGLRQVAPRQTQRPAQCHDADKGQRDKPARATALLGRPKAHRDHGQQMINGRRSRDEKTHRGNPLDRPATIVGGSEVGEQQHGGGYSRRDRKNLCHKSDAFASFSSGVQHINSLGASQMVRKQRRMCGVACPSVFSQHVFPPR